MGCAACVVFNWRFSGVNLHSARTLYTHTYKTSFIGSRFLTSFGGTLLYKCYIRIVISIICPILVAAAAAMAVDYDDCEAAFLFYDPYSFTIGAGWRSRKRCHNNEGARRTGFTTRTLVNRIATITTFFNETHRLEFRILLWWRWWRWWWCVVIEWRHTAVQLRSVPALQGARYNNIIISLWRVHHAYISKVGSAQSFSGQTRFVSAH